MSAFPFSSLRVRLLLTAGVVALAFGGWHLARSGEGVAPEPPLPSAQPIVARGRIEPVGRVRAIQGPSDSGVVQELRVDRGDRVAAGQILAVLDGYDIRQAELAVAERTLALAELQREQTVAGAKRSDIAAQRSALAAKEARREMLEREWLRRRALFADGHVSQQSLDSLSADRKTAENEVSQALHLVKALTETRGVDDRVAQARAEVERAGVERARAQLEHLVVRAPMDGVILSVHSRAGELIGQDGLLRMAALDRIEVVAEVEENQAMRLSEGMAAIIESRLLDQPVSGRLTRLSHEIYREKRPASDVLTGRDARIVEVDVTPDRPLPAVLGAEVLVRLVPAAQPGAR